MSFWSCETVLDGCEDFLPGIGVDQDPGQSAERRELAFAADALRVFDDDAEHALDLSRWRLRAGYRRRCGRSLRGIRCAPE